MPTKKLGFHETIRQRHEAAAGSSGMAGGARRRPMGLDATSALYAVAEAAAHADQTASASPAMRVQQALAQLQSPGTPISPFGTTFMLGSSGMFLPVQQQQQQHQAGKTPNEARREQFAISLINVADWHLAKGELDRAHTIFEQALFMLDKSRRKGEHLKSYAQILNGLGRVLEKKQQFDVAAVHFREADTVLREDAQQKEKNRQKMPTAQGAAATTMALPAPAGTGRPSTAAPRMNALAATAALALAATGEKGSPTPATTQQQPQARPATASSASDASRQSPQQPPQQPLRQHWMHEYARNSNQDQPRTRPQQQSANHQPQQAPQRSALAIARESVTRFFPQPGGRSGLPLHPGVVLLSPRAVTSPSGETFFVF